MGKSGIDILDEDVQAYAEKGMPVRFQAEYREILQIEFRKDDAERLEKKRATQRDSGSSDLNDLSNDLTRMDKDQIDKLKSIEQVRKLRFQLEKDRGEYVNRKTVTEVFHQLYSIDTAEFATMADRAAPEIASICGVDDGEVIVQIAKFLETESYRTMAHVKQKLNNFLRGMESREIV
jgi:hypothetical protein